MRSVMTLQTEKNPHQSRRTVGSNGESTTAAPDPTILPAFAVGLTRLMAAQRRA